MFLKLDRKSFAVIIFAILFFTACKNSGSVFEQLSSSHTNIKFENKPAEHTAFGILYYLYYYNGGGVGAGDFNNDGKIDLFFGSNQGQNKLYLNTGDLKFKDVTAAANIPDDGGWTTGISVVDINNDGLLDIFTTDMLPEDDYRLKSVTRFDDYDVFNAKLKNDFQKSRGYIT